MLPFYQQELKVGADGEEDRLMFIWPMTIVHKINEKSPLYNLSASDMLRERFEIVVMLGEFKHINITCFIHCLVKPESAHEDLFL